MRNRSYRHTGKQPAPNPHNAIFRFTKWCRISFSRVSDRYSDRGVTLCSSFIFARKEFGFQQFAQGMITQVVTFLNAIGAGCRDPYRNVGEIRQTSTMLPGERNHKSAGNLSGTICVAGITACANNSLLIPTLSFPTINAGLSGKIHIEKRDISDL